MIYIKNDDIKLAEPFLKDIINNTASYDTAVDAINLYLKRNKSNESIHNSRELFGILAIKFPIDPEYSKSRLMHLQYILCNCNCNCDKNDNNSSSINNNNISISNQESNQYDMTTALELCNAIINDHRNNNHILIGDNLIKITKMLHDQYKYYYCIENWLLAIQWSNIYLNLVSTATYTSTDSMNQDDLLPVYLHITGI
jgi:hypothetical protein